MLETKAVKLGDLRSALQILADSEYTFFLTGSRRFGHAASGSDWDFFVQKDGEVESWLVKHGFTRLTGDAAYKGIPGTTVYRKENVDVQVRVNAEQFEKINCWLDTHPAAYKDLLAARRRDREDLVQWKAIWSFLNHVV